MSYIIRELRISRNASPEAVGNLMDGWLVALGPIALIDVQAIFREKPAVTVPRVTFSYDEDGDVQYRAAVFQSDSEADAFFAGFPEMRPVRVVDITPRLRRRLPRDEVMVVYQEKVKGPCAGQVSEWSRPLIVSPTADIAAGASGPAEIISTVGAISQFVTVSNAFDFLWSTGVPGLAMRDPTGCGWVGYPPCC
jgi:hypothetical protein